MRSNRAESAGNIRVLENAPGRQSKPPARGFGHCGMFGRGRAFLLAHDLR